MRRGCRRHCLRCRITGGLDGEVAEVHLHHLALGLQLIQLVGQRPAQLHFAVGIQDILGVAGLQDGQKGIVDLLRNLLEAFAGCLARAFGRKIGAHLPARPEDAELAQGLGVHRLIADHAFFEGVLTRKPSPVKALFFEFFELRISQGFPVIEIAHHQEAKAADRNEPEGDRKPGEISARSVGRVDQLLQLGRV